MATEELEVKAEEGQPEEVTEEQAKGDDQDVLMVGVFVDRTTGAWSIRTAPGVDPVALFAEAIINVRKNEAMWLQQQAQRPQILVPQAKLPPNLKGRQG